MASFLHLRGALLTALGLSISACGGNVVVGSGGTGGGGGGATASSLCKNPQPILQPSGKETGFVTCDDGAIDRIKKVTCDPAAPSKDSCSTPGMAGNECDTAADCTAMFGGHCMGGPAGPCACAYDYPYKCETDADCGAGQVCACAGAVDPSYSVCINAGCSEPADCATGECGLSYYNDGCSDQHDMTCRLEADACRTEAGCVAGQQCGTMGGNSGFQCLDYTCTIGRPLYVDNVARFAPARRRADWLADRPLPETASLSVEVKAALGAHFTAMGAMEHASIGSFARFSLELLALGAPPSLLHAAHAAAADEIVHAELAYALATAYSGEPVGPGALSIAGVVPCSDPRDIVVALVREACVGETIAAAEALALAGLVEDPALTAAHTQVAEDEARHAELGWRTLAWMLKERPELGIVADQAFTQAIREISGAPLSASSIVEPRVGLLSSSALAEIRSQAAREIVEPCRRGLMEEALSGRTKREKAPQPATDLHA